MNTEEIVQYLKSNPTELYNVCETLRLRFPFENKEDLMQVYNSFKKSYDHCIHNFNKCTDTKKKHELSETCNKLRNVIQDMEIVYHIFSPNFDEEAEKRWLPKEYDKDARAVFDFRKQMYRTQAINEDLDLTAIIADDMSNIWSEKGGQDGMYDSFPFTFTRESIEKEYDEYNDYLKTNCHYTIKVIRSYALDSSGGIAIIERRIYTHFDDMSNVIPEAQDSYTSRQQIVTLGEDDGFHFLNGRRIYEDCTCTTDKFLSLLKLVQKEFKTHI